MQIIIVIIMIIIGMQCIYSWLKLNKYATVAPWSILISDFNFEFMNSFRSFVLVWESIANCATPKRKRLVSICPRFENLWEILYPQVIWRHLSIEGRKEGFPQVKRLSLADFF